jgi:hypothetical protein
MTVYIPITKQPTQILDDDDDLYFDDGDFGDLDVNNQDGGFWGMIAVASVVAPRDGC